MFQFRNPPSGKNAALAEQITTQKMISLHVRRGDYVQNATVNAKHGTCSLDYYKKAVAYIAERVENPHFLIFSDDIAWCKTELNTGFEQSFVDFPNPNYEDMRLMSLCSHHIIANSSFSWWGAWLNPNPNKMVVAPTRWMAGEDLDTKDLLPETWVRV